MLHDRNTARSWEVGRSCRSIGHSNCWLMAVEMELASVEPDEVEYVAGQLVCLKAEDFCEEAVARETFV